MCMVAPQGFKNHIFFQSTKVKRPCERREEEEKKKIYRLGRLMGGDEWGEGKEEVKRLRLG